MSLDLRVLQRLQRDTGFNIDFLEKAYHITRILLGIFTYKGLKENLALKGGTALNFVYLDIPRLSVDLDLNYTGSLEKEEMLRKRKEILQELYKLAGSLGYKISKRPESYIMERLLLKYKRLSGLQDSIRVEINYLERVPVIKIVHKTFNHFFNLKEFRVKTYILEEIAAMKTKAMVERLYARDIFDIYQISQLRLDKILLRKLMILYILMVGRKPEIDSLISKVKKYDEKEMTKAIKPFLREEWNKSLEPKKIKRTVEEFYRKIFIPDESDLSFLKALDSKKLNLKILFGKLGFNPQAEKHPALLWALNIE
jgi:hypothetical protein